MAVGTCVECGTEKDKQLFSANQWKRKTTRRCHDCVEAAVKPPLRQPADKTIAKTN